MFAHSRHWKSVPADFWSRASRLRSSTAARNWDWRQYLGWRQANQPWPRPLAVSGSAASSPLPDDVGQREPGDQRDAGDQRDVGEAGLDEDSVDRRRRMEAVLLFHRGPVTLRKLAQLAGLADATEARTLLRQLNEIYDKTVCALRVEEVAGGFQLLTRPGLAPWLRRFASAPAMVRLSSPAMETLAIVAYRQPVLRANIEAIRGVACSEILRQLMQRDLVRICGRSEELGRPYLYGTTKHFLQTFGLKDAQSLPALTGAGVEDDSEDTCANSTDLHHAEPTASPIDPTDALSNSPSDVPSFDAVTQKESDVSTVCVLDELCLSLPTSPLGSSDASPADLSFVSPLSEPRAADDDDDEFYDDDDDDEDDEDDDEVADDDEEWEDEEEEDVEGVEGDDAEDEVADEWEEVGDDEEEDEDEEDAESDDEDEDEDWDDEDEDEDWDDDDDEEDDEEEEEEWD